MTGWRWGAAGGPAPRIEILEVAARDGLQNDPAMLSTDDKVALIARSIATGIRRIEVASFARPDRVPQMADAEAVIAALPDWEDVITVGLVMNAKGAERALATKVAELGAVCVASDAFAERNQRQTALESVEIAREVVARARAGGRRGQITIATAFGCPFSGEVDAGHVVDMAKRAADAQPVEVALADTIGCAVPAQVADLIGRTREAIAPLPVRAHFHNTRNAGIANVWAAVEAGAATIDASLGGIGGCPFAPKATGNVPTEDVLYLLSRSGVGTGVDLDRTIEAAQWLSTLLGRTLPGMVSRAGPFPKSDYRTERTDSEWATA